MTDQELVQKFSQLQISVMGDLMMDEYVIGEASRVSPESPVLVIDVIREMAVPGGAANVAANVMALGAKARVFGSVGDDEKGRELCRSLAERGAETSGIVIDDSRPTTRKTRVIAQSQQVLRVDRESSEPLDEQLARNLAGNIESSLESVDAILVSDYAKGVVSRKTVAGAISRANAQGKPFIANGKPEHANEFQGASVVSFNSAEALAASGDPRFKTDDIEEAGETLRTRMNIDCLMVTRGPKGIWAWTAAGETHAVPARPVEVYDVAGAGDTVISTVALSLAAGAGLEQAIHLAVVAASIVVGKVGVASLEASELLDTLRQ